MMKELVEYIVKELVDKPEAVDVKEMEGEKACVVELRVAPEDVGRVIGKQGRVIKSIRLLANASAIRKNKRVTVEVIG
jgi:uncharacterized protein